MQADVLLQFIEACVCLLIGAYFGVKFAFTEVIGECSGNVLRSVLEFIFGLSYALYLGFAIYMLVDGNLKYYHFVLQFVGLAGALPISRKVFVRYKSGIQKFWLLLLGKKELPEEEIVINIEENVQKTTDNNTEVKTNRKMIKNRRLKTKNNGNRSGKKRFIDLGDNSGIKPSKKKSIGKYHSFSKNNKAINTKNKNTINNGLRKQKPK